jgi:hypothetical protein
VRQADETRATSLAAPGHPRHSCPGPHSGARRRRLAGHGGRALRPGGADAGFESAGLRAVDHLDGADGGDRPKHPPASRSHSNDRGRRTRAGRHALPGSAAQPDGRSLHHRDLRWSRAGRHTGPAAACARADTRLHARSGGRLRRLAGRCPRRLRHRPRGPANTHHHPPPRRVRPELAAGSRHVLPDALQRRDNAAGGPVDDGRNVFFWLEPWPRTLWLAT